MVRSMSCQVPLEVARPVCGDEQLVLDREKQHTAPAGCITNNKRVRLMSDSG
jgi:hypothetical protein